MPIRDACHNMMGRIPSSPNAFLVFGNRGQPGVDVGLPLVFFDSECSLLVVVYTAFSKGEQRMLAHSVGYFQTFANVTPPSSPLRAPILVPGERSGILWLIL